MFKIEPLDPDDWLTLRYIRLAALQESPDAFLGTYAQQKAYTEDQWRAEFDRGCWYGRLDDGLPMSLLGVTSHPDIPVDARYLEYLWVAPGYRGRGIALAMIIAILDCLRAAGLQTAFLWVLDSNDAAVRLYKRAGFIRSNDRQPLKDRPGRFEERLYLNLA